MEKEVRGSWKVFKCSRQQKRIEIVGNGRIVAVDQLASWASIRGPQSTVLVCPQVTRLP
jgi:hypothetical protein